MEGLAKCAILLMSVSVHYSSLFAKLTLFEVEIVMICDAVYDGTE